MWNKSVRSEIQEMFAGFAPDLYEEQVACALEQRELAKVSARDAYKQANQREFLRATGRERQLCLTRRAGLEARYVMTPEEFREHTRRRKARHVADHRARYKLATPVEVRQAEAAVANRERSLRGARAPMTESQAKVTYLAARRVFERELAKKKFDRAFSDAKNDMGAALRQLRRVRSHVA
jgi:hypothetical protein